jgi:hypothetical protein
MDTVQSYNLHRILQWPLVSLTRYDCIAGIEIDFAGMSPEELQLTRSIADEVGLEISVTLVTTNIALRNTLPDI